VCALVLDRALLIAPGALLASLAHLWPTSGPLLSDVAERSSHARTALNERLEGIGTHHVKESKQVLGER
jgi:hypothetical protein